MKRCSPALGLLIALAIASPVSAHGEAVFQLGAERVQPGSSIEVRGDVGSGYQFDVALVSDLDGSRRAIGTIAAIEEGHFQAYVVIPEDTGTGEYVLEVTTAEIVVSAPLTVAGPAAGVEAGQQGGQDEGLQPLAPPAHSTLGEAADAGSVMRPGEPVAAGPVEPGIPLIGRLGIVVVALIAGVSLLGTMRVLGTRRQRHPVR